MKSFFFRNYPAGFGSLFYSQIFFNFSFYGLKSIFVLYVLSQYSLEEKEAFSLFAAFMSLSYATSLIGGFLADKGLGSKRTIILGGLLSVTGVMCLLSSSKDFIFLSLAFLSLGSGFFKPNLSSAVGQLFEDPHDSQKDAAYSTFYVAMNIGSFLSPLMCGFVGKVFGWHYALVFIAIIIFIGTWIVRSNSFLERTQREESYPLRKALTQIMNKEGFLKFLMLQVFVVLMVFSLYLLFKYRDSFHGLMGIIAVISLFCLGKVYYQCDPLERKNVLKIGIYILLFSLFCSLFEQAGSSLMLFFERAVDRHVMGFPIPSSAFLSLGPVFVLMASPLLLFLSKTMFEKKKPMDGLMKMAIGFLLVGSSFWILSLSVYQSHVSVSPFWVIGALFIQTFGELLIVPIGFSNISKLSPKRNLSLMMSLWLMAIAYGHYFAGFIARFSINEVIKTNGNGFHHYSGFFFKLGSMPLVLGMVIIVLITLSASLKK